MNQYRIIKKENLLDEIEYLPQYLYRFLGFIPIWISLIEEGYEFSHYFPDINRSIKLINQDIENTKRNTIKRIEYIPYEQL